MITDQDKIIDVIKSSTITDAELHEDTGELLTIWIRTPKGDLVRVTPVGYKMCVDYSPWAEEYHG